MSLSALNLRLQHLEENVAQILQLLNDYEKELIYEDDPGRKGKYRRRIEDLKHQKNNYDEELAELRTQLVGEQSTKVQTISNQLQEIDFKLDLLLDSQVTLHRALLSHFNAGEQALIRPFAEKLDEPQLIEIEAVLEAVDVNPISETEVHQILDETRQLLLSLQQHNLALPGNNNAVLEVLNEPTIDAKHALKVSVPIIPFILSYEGELGLGAGIKLRESWESLKGKFSRNK
ncbi:MAG: hypothetical protein Kow00121_46270 [Elainellaceae cyanobacterium]